MLAGGARRPLQARRLDGEHRLGITCPERSQPIETGDAVATQAGEAEAGGDA